MGGGAWKCSLGLGSQVAAVTQGGSIAKRKKGKVVLRDRWQSGLVKDRVAYLSMLRPMGSH